MTFRPEVDGLRALAVLPVMLFHAGFDWFSGGFVGVDVFFVISGCLITGVIISEMAAGAFRLRHLYEPRARRFLPALFLVMACCAPFAWLWLIPNDLKRFGESLAGAATLTSNILLWQQSGYFDTGAELKPLLHTWSLAVEEQFYILFPLILPVLWRFGVKWRVILLSLLGLGSLVAAVLDAQFSHESRVISGVFYLGFIRAWVFAHRAVLTRLHSGVQTRRLKLANRLPRMRKLANEHPFGRIQ